MPRCVVAFLIILAACAPTRFDRRTTATLAPGADTRAQVIALADQVAREFGLSLDEASATNHVRGYFGRPAHYYQLSLIDLPDGRLSVTYRHEITLSAHRRAKTGPEDKFYSELRTRFAHDVIEASPPADRK